MDTWETTGLEITLTAAVFIVGFVDTPDGSNRYKLPYWLYTIIERLMKSLLQYVECTNEFVFRDFSSDNLNEKW